MISSSRTERQTDTDTHESDYCGHPFRVSGVFPSTYHQGSAQLSLNQQFFLDITVIILQVKKKNDNVSITLFKLSIPNNAVMAKHTCVF